MTDRTSAIRILDRIRPSTPKRRFLQSWDRDARVLRFGFGDDATGVYIRSDRVIEENAQSPMPTKLERSTALGFIDGRTADSPLTVVQTILREYIYFEDARVYTLLSVWILGTYVYSMFSHYGYLFLYSPTPRCGKTRVEELTSHLAFEATNPLNAPTPPTMRETAVSGGTAIFDTLERWKEKDSFGAAMELLDAGFRNGGVVTKMLQDKGGDWRRELYPVYAPYMFAAINRESLTDTARDRSFEIEMVRKSTRTKTRAYDDGCETACAPIRDHLYLAALTHAMQIDAVYRSSELQRRMDALGLNDRAADIWKPLLAIAVAFNELAVADELGALAQQMSPDPDRLEERRQLSILRGLRALAGTDGVVTGTTQ
jgi:hypothetical protein